jgi:peptide/nickel transport system permease protein
MTVSFALVRLLPGNPVDFLIVDLVQQGVEPAEAAQRAQNMLNIDPTKPLHIAYFEYMFDVLQGGLGQSTWYSEPVTAVIGRALPWTILVMSYGVLLSFLLGIVGGAFMAYFEGEKLDLALTSYATFMSRSPTTSSLSSSSCFWATGSGSSRRRGGSRPA